MTERRRTSNHNTAPPSQSPSALLGRRVSAIRRSNGWSLRELAKRCAMSPSTLHRLENGIGSLLVDQLPGLARGLKVSVGELLDDDFDTTVIHVLRAENARLKAALREMTEK